MGWTVLYIAFGIVALWLLGEVLLQYKARLRWRLLAFVGFLTVVLGVLVPSVPVIGAGAIAFAIGQTYVTLSFRSGFSSGWSVPNAPAWARRRDDDVPEYGEAYDGYDDRETYDDHRQDYEGHDGHEGSETAPDAVPSAHAEAPDPVYTPQPMPDETGQYGVYDDSARQAAEQQGIYDGYPGYTGYGQGGLDPYGQDVNAAAHSTYGDGGYPGGQAGPDGQGIYTGGQDAYAEAGFDYNNSGQYAGYTDPYGQQGYDPYSGYGQGYDTSGYPADPYGRQQYGTETPPGGVWVPQQRDGDQQYQQQDGEQPYPYQGGYDNHEPYETGYDGQYRY
ncbi:hypothetical protein [Streptomyces meridianus]|uniref:Uncharacterized protein n=1 Tax=Streptomyces meridianus TaxID=2938945 RepID=A0ABT0X3P6_9ACTN|nr:hypothetical protein [Streptomyces meridianus]MCM2576439.1 hypothetical protein [Streptomyces meridianus]